MEKRTGENSKMLQQKVEEQYKSIGGTYFDKYAQQMQKHLDEKTRFVEKMLSDLYGRVAIQ